MPPRIAVLIPCLNEERSISTVVGSFFHALPGASVYVYDNNSTDRTAAVAAAAGAVTGLETTQGKGHTVVRMFREVDADIYVLVDGDDTYDASAAPGMVDLLVQDRLDMVIARRCSDDPNAWPRGHRLGNALFTQAIDLLFGSRLHDVLSGYRVFSRDFVKSFDATAGGFEIETELTVHALTRGFQLQEVDTPYRARQVGSVSKLRTFRDGLRIARAIGHATFSRVFAPKPEEASQPRPPRP